MSQSAKPFSPAVLNEDVKEHLAYLERMAANGVVPASLVAKAREVWWLAWNSTSGLLPIPAAAAFSGGPFEYHWAVGPHRVSVEIPTDGPCHWFYRNTSTEEIMGSDLPSEDGLPPQFEEYLHRLVASDY